MRGFLKNHESPGFDSVPRRNGPTSSGRLVSAIRFGRRVLCIMRDREGAGFRSVGLPRQREPGHGRNWNGDPVGKSIRKQNWHEARGRGGRSRGWGRVRAITEIYALWRRDPGERRKKEGLASLHVAEEKYLHTVRRDLIASLLVFVSPRTRISKLTRLDRYVY